MELISLRNNALKNFMEKGTSESQELLKEMRQNLLRDKRRAKRNRQFTYAEKCQQKDFRSNPKEAWRMISYLISGFQEHHKSLTKKNLQRQKREASFQQKAKLS
jgi:hypothetical protein